MKAFIESLSEKGAIERLRLLEDNADQIQETTYFRKFDEEEIADFKELNTQNDIELDALDKERKRVLEPIDTRIKELKKTKSHTLQNIIQGRESVSGKLYVIHSEDERITYHLDTEGRIVAELPLMKQQTSIYQRARAVNE